MSDVMILCDFDGTITLRDTNDALVDHFVGAERRAAYDELFLKGRVPLWQALDQALRACGVPLETALAHLHAHVPIDPHFAGFTAWCAAREWPVRVVSAGLHEVITRLLQREGLELPVVANRARPADMTFGLEPVDPTCPTGVDKAAVVQAARSAGFFTVFIGDGISDRLAVPHADWVLAKGSLVRWCERHGHAHTAITSFAEVSPLLAQRLGPGPRP